MKKKKLIFILALFAVIWNSCFDDLPYPRRQERNQKTTDDAISLNAVKKYYSHIPLLTLPQTQNKANGGHGMNDSIDTTKDSTHVHTDACQHKHHTRGLPDIQESNIVPLWDEAREWSDSASVYIEIPLNISGGKLYAHKTMKRKGKKTIFERVRPESMLVFEQRLGKKKTDCYMVTLIGEKDYMKKHGKKMKTMRHIPDDHAFTGVWYKSYPSGRIQSAYYYTNGKRTHKIFRAGCQQQSDYSKDNDFLSISLVDRSLSASSYSIDWENDVYYCAFCGLYHTYDGGGCEVLIEYCTRCGQNVDDCNCCYYCGNDPCTCNVCFVCGSDPCTCYSQCPDCGHDPCICCPDCRNYPCTCCPNCGNDPCTCDDENTEPDNPDDCNGPKCPICGGLIVDDVATRASVSCQICDGDPCAVCGKRHCNEVHTNDPCSKSQLLSGDADFRNKVDLFFDKNQTEYFEDGWLKTSTGEYISPSNRTESSLSYDYSRQVAGKLITEHYHCHPAITGQSCITSLSDLKKMAFYYQKGNIDVDNYSFGVISDIGCLSIIITSEDLFAIFADKVYNENKESDDVINSAWEDNITNVKSGIPEESIGKLIRFFNSTNAGLSVMFRPMSPTDKNKDWVTKIVNENDQYSNKNCN
ncbi:hypothetical protein [Bacteroides sp. MSB163]|uniref:hypothetical protein n=1 Tax=Bacteroides maternus TaxID=3117552 RepID=UPI002EDA2649